MSPQQNIIISLLKPHPNKIRIFIYKDLQGLLVFYNYLSLLTQKLNSTYYKETVNISSNHSFQPSIKRLMIMLPLHGQNTAALQLQSVGRPDLKLNSKGHVFDKQANTNFAQFLFINYQTKRISHYVYTNFIIITITYNFVINSNTPFNIIIKSYLHKIIYNIILMIANLKPTILYNSTIIITLTLKLIP